MAAMTADRRLWLTADGSRVVEDGDPEAASLFAAPGRPISADDVERFGLSEQDGKVVIKMAAKPEDKAVKKPAAKAEEKDEK